MTVQPAITNTLHRQNRLNKLNMKIECRKLRSRIGRATALSLPDNYAEIVGRKETRPTYMFNGVKVKFMENGA